MRGTSWVRAVLAGTVMLTAGACAATGTPVDPAPVRAVERPQPVGVEINPPPPSGPAVQVPTCDPTESLRPIPLPPPGQMPPGSTMRRIQDRGRLVAGVDQNTFLFGFRNPSTNALEGFDIDRVREIATAIFGDPDKVHYKVISSAERVDALVEGEVDIVVRTMTATCERWQKISFSATYYLAGQRLLVDKRATVSRLDDLAGQRVCAARGSTSIGKIASHPSKPVPVATDTWSDCLVMLQQGQVAAVSTDDTILAGMAAQDPNVKIVGERFTEEPYGIGVPKSNEDMVRFVNAVLEKSIRDRDWAASYARWLGPTGQTASPPVPKYRG